MKQVYIVMKVTEYEGTYEGAEVLGVFATPQKANAFCAEAALDPEEDDIHHEVYEYAVQE